MTKDFADQVLRSVNPEEDLEFQPFAIYDHEGDGIEFFAAPDSFYSERFDKWISVYRSHDTGRIVGFFISNMSRVNLEKPRRYSQ